MIRRIVFIGTVIIFSLVNLKAQTTKPTYAPNTTKEARAKEYKYLISSINKNLLTELVDSTEENWQDAFAAMMLLNYHAPFIDSRIHTAMGSVEKRSTGFQRSLLQMIYPLYPKAFVPEVISLAGKTTDAKLFAMCCEYLLLNNRQAECKELLSKKANDNPVNPTTENPFFRVLQNKLNLKTPSKPPLADLLAKDFLPGEMVLFSFQRSNRNFAGLVMVRNKNGAFIKNETGKYFAVPQLARSCSNMPGYITNGNTPQGIFKVFGFDTSKSAAIGPTTNIQMVLPYEQSQDVGDSVTRSLGDNYRYLLPASWKSYYPVFEAYYAGKAGRTEIIAHGTTINPEYYKKQTYYPLTPTEGCLCTKEIWSGTGGKRLESDQEKLVNAIKKAGGANGYCVVIEIDDQQKPVSLADILLFLKTSPQ
ncbi:MAG: hypothetical protein JNM14_03860 [Ferruginibacter sp.]|nr:hypothetical protein [Ferruginibacter sp.]